MAKHCIGCKREIGQGQQECYICGSSQNYIRYYLKSVIVFILLLVAMTWLGYGYIDKRINQAKRDNTIQAGLEMQAATKKIRELEQQLEQVNVQVQQAEVNTAQSSEAANEEKLKLVETEKRAKKAGERAGWLSKENRRFKAKIKELTEKLSAAKTVVQVRTPQAAPTNSQLASLKQELASYESQKQTLVSNISSKQKQLEASWQQASGGAPVSPDMVAQRAQQLEQATAGEKNQVLLLDGQIEAVKKKISDIEGGSS